MQFKRLWAIAITLLAGCGVNNPTLQVTLDRSATQAFADGNGVERVLSFDVARAKAQEATRPFAHRTTRGTLPAQVDLRAICSPVGDQGKLGSCTSFAMVRGLREFLLNQNHETYTELSPLYHYYKERVIENTVNDDSGATITDGMTVLKDTGVCPEKDWPYYWIKFKMEPSAKAEASAPQFKIKRAIPIKGETPEATLELVKEQLSQGHALAFGFEVFKSFMHKDTAKTGILPMPKEGEKIVGGHAVLVVGYDDEKKMLIVRNSWSKYWGQQGYFYMPYRFLPHCFDFWAAE